MTRATRSEHGQLYSAVCDSTRAETGGKEPLAPVELAKLNQRVCPKCLATSSRKEKQVPPGPRTQSTLVRLKQLVKAASAAGIVVNSVECSPDGTIRVSNEASRAEPDDLSESLARLWASACGRVHQRR